MSFVDAIEINPSHGGISTLGYQSDEDDETVSLGDDEEEEMEEVEVVCIELEGSDRIDGGSCQMWFNRKRREEIPNGRDRTIILRRSLAETNVQKKTNQWTYLGKTQDVHAIQKPFVHFNIIRHQQMHNKQKTLQSILKPSSVSSSENHKSTNISLPRPSSNTEPECEHSKKTAITFSPTVSLLKFNNTKHPSALRWRKNRDEELPMQKPNNSRLRRKPVPKLPSYKSQLNQATRGRSTVRDNFGARLGSPPPPPSRASLSPPPRATYSDAGSSASEKSFGQKENQEGNLKTVATSNDTRAYVVRRFASTPKNALFDDTINANEKSSSSGMLQKRDEEDDDDIRDFSQTASVAIANNPGKRFMSPPRSTMSDCDDTTSPPRTTSHLMRVALFDCGCSTLETLSPPQQKVYKEGVVCAFPPSWEKKRKDLPFPQATTTATSTAAEF